MVAYTIPSLSSLIWVTVLALLLYKLVDWYRRYTKWVAIYNRLPGNKKTHWLWGNIHEFPGLDERGLNFNINEDKLYPRIRRSWVSKFRCVVIVSHPDTIKQVLTKTALQAPKSRGAGVPLENGIGWLGEGLLIANGSRWARNRKLLTPAFHYDILNKYLVIANQCADVLLDKLEGFSKTGKPFDVFQHVGLCSLDIILQCAFSYKADSQTKGEVNPYVQSVMALSDLWAVRCFNPLIYSDWIYFNFTSSGKEFLKHCKFVHGVAEDIINKRRDTLKKEGLPEDAGDTKKKLDFLDIILTAKDGEGRGLTDIEIRNEVDTFLFEGHDTTTSATSFILLSLAEHPEIQAKCQQEVDAIFDGRDTDHIEWKDLVKLEYLTQCIKEGLRLHTPVYYIQRQVSEDTNIDGYHIPAWTHIGINLHGIHHDETVWGKDHNEFKPERFTPDNIAKMHPFQFVPFSAGQRNCIGQNFAMNEIKVLISRILHRYTLSVESGQKIEKHMSIVMKTVNGVLLKAVPRQR